MSTKMTPQLRFPEFTDEWRVRKFSEIADGKLSNGVFNDPSKVGSGYKLINVKDMYVDGFIDESSLTKVNINAREFSKNKVKNGDLFFTRSSLVKEGIAYTNIYLSNSEDITFDGHLIKLSPDKAQTSPEFLYYISKSNASRRQLVTFGTTTTMTTIGQREVANVILYFPSKPEQEKIADFLTAVDERIAVGEKKLELLETYKRGVMQKIFSQQIRFKNENGNPYPDWKEKAVSEFLKERKEYTSKGGDLEHISLTTAGVVPKSERYERDFLVGSTDKQYRITRLDDICYNPANLKFGVIARNKYKDGIFSPIYVTYVVNNADIGFVEYLVTSRDFIQRARKYEQGTVYERMAVSPQDLAKIKVRTPVIEEQQKIANFLTTLDDKITAEKSKLTATKQFKKALLQRMFV